MCTSGNDTIAVLPATAEPYNDPNTPCAKDDALTLLINQLAIGCDGELASIL